MKVIIGLSGGVDSAVSAYLLKQQGYQVHAVFMRNWDENDEHCPATADLQDARLICADLDIPFTSVNFADLYWDRVFEYFLAEYRAGRTPNPDIICNQEIKFKAFLDYALTELHADKIATGHYAQLLTQNDHFELHKAHDDNKDQSYFLYRLNQYQLSKSIFPLAELTKPDVRKLAEKLHFTNHAKKDSTGICFIGERKFKTFLQNYVLSQPGDIVTENGDIIGRHEGLMFYTIGQRQGIGIGGLKTHDQGAWYVLAKDLNKNQLLVGQGQANPKLYRHELICEQVHWIAGIAPNLPLKCHCKIRYRQADQACEIIKISDQQLHIRFSNPQRAVTSGQSVVFYDGSHCLGGGIIV